MALELKALARRRGGERRLELRAHRAHRVRVEVGEKIVLRAGPYMKYSCTGCGGGWTYARLIGQIGRETLRRKNGQRLAADKDMTRSVPYFLRK